VRQTSKEKRKNEKREEEKMTTYLGQSLRFVEG
jgi:hypothetical protein